VALLSGCLVLMIGGFVLGGKASRLRPDLAGTGAALLVVAGVSVWLGVTAGRRNPRKPANLGVGAPDLPPGPRVRMPRTRVPLRARLRPAMWIPGLRAVASRWVATLLTVAVLFGVLLTVHDGPAARAYRDAPVCVGETNLATCRGEFTAMVNGVRSDPQAGSNYADVAYATSDGAINAWGRFDGDGSALARAAQADEKQRMLLTIAVWRGSIVGAELGPAWHWAQGNPPGNAIPAAFLAVSFALLLLWVRLRIHRRQARMRTQADDQSLIIDDICQLAAAAGAVVLLAYGLWPGAILALATLVWLGLSAKRARAPRAIRLSRRYGPDLG
jgi:hypothetical protein